VGEATVAGHEVWVQARKDNDFKAFQPILPTLVDLARRRAETVNPHAPAYDVLTTSSSPTRRWAGPIFAELKAFLCPSSRRWGGGRPSMRGARTTSRR
jgi:Zn-dependent M32 family carboxypeptidase